MVGSSSSSNISTGSSTAHLISSRSTQRNQRKHGCGTPSKDANNPPAALGNIFVNKEKLYILFSSASAVSGEEIACVTG
jgi:hypothetical protein